VELRKLLDDTACVAEPPEVEDRHRPSEEKGDADASATTIRPLGAADPVPPAPKAPEMGEAPRSRARGRRQAPCEDAARTSHAADRRSRGRGGDR
jgi:hypothetical protein